MKDHSCVCPQDKLVWLWPTQDSKVTFHLLALVFNLLPWLVLTALPLCTAARVTSNYRALNKVRQGMQRLISTNCMMQCHAFMPS